MNSSTLEAHVHNLRVRIEGLSKEHESLSLEHSKLKSRMFREQLKFRFLQMKMQSHQIVDRLPIGRWFIFLCVPLCLAAVGLVLSDVILHVRMLSVAFAASTWVLSVVALAVLLSGMGNCEFKPQVQHCQDVCMQMQLQAGEMNNRKVFLKQQIGMFESQLVAAAQELRIVQEKNSFQRVCADLYRQNWKAMRDVEFEQFLEKVFLALGYSVETTAVTGDQGVDLLVSKNGVRVAIQVKGYHSSVSNGAIQEAFAGMAHYKCHACAVITNSRFTSSAVALAKSTNCRLIDEECFRDFVMGRIEVVPSLTH
jgi:hypothetical protein